MIPIAKRIDCDQPLMSMRNETVESLPARMAIVRRSVSSAVTTYAPVIGFLAALVLLGIAFREHLDFSQQPLEPYRMFFELLVAGLVISLLRSKVGLVTYGMFGPIVISFILIESGLLWGLVLFVNVFLIALATYLVIQPFRLGTAHRICALVMTVAIAITTFHIMSDNGTLPQEVNALQAFFPAIITAWYADRFARELTERGWRAPAVRFSWTMVAIVAAYAVVANGTIVTWFMQTPESWAFVFAANVYLGAQSSTRLKEYLRFSNVYGQSRFSVLRASVRARLHNARARLRGLFGAETSRVEPTSVMAMNRRNRLIKQYNPQHLYPELDKASMKRAFHGTGVPTPETYALVGSLSDLSTAEEIIDTRDEFVIKPDSGYGGEGIIVVNGRTENGDFETSKGRKTPEQLLAHTRSIVEGQYDPMGLEGVAVIEGLVHPDDQLLSIAGQGVPDVRVIVFKGYPIMAMTRLPTEESDGAANLHMGAVGVGLSIADGKALGGYQSTNKWFDDHPDTGVDLEAFYVHNWGQILDTAVMAAEVSRLGYTGVDIVVDETEGPMVLEINARPGLGIQNSTFDGLLERTEFVEKLPDSFDLKSPGEKIELARTWDRVDWTEDAIELEAQWARTDADADRSVRTGDPDHERKRESADGETDGQEEVIAR
ncbi:hypothetical protein EA473_07990 [Natrarchaeobius chitinivorans]|uniref:ATP-grasp domain-containing protein n=2 Tax=Natrarchaeobius chitinivorans TaxID=1679083 RepID=A0A3N6MLX1_NATCH|nr:hypothetical protein EA473_07990 [Natrarchaeobius chitinivorans]